MAKQSPKCAPDSETPAGVASCTRVISVTIRCPKAVLPLPYEPIFLRPLLPCCRRGRLAVRIERPHDPNARQHDVSAVLDDKHQRLDRCSPFRRIMLALRELRDESGGVAEGVQLAALRQ
jgi:hypothetical protein